MAGMRWEVGAVAAKVEASEGTAVTLTATEANILAENISLTYEMPFFERHAISPSLSQFAGTLGGPRIGTLTFDVKLAGSGTAGTAPGWADLLECCGWLETDTVNSDTYTPETTNSTYTVGLYVDGKAHKLAGCAGDVSFDFNAGEPAVMHYKIQGVYSVPTDTATLEPTIAGSTPVANCGGAFTLDSKALNYKSFSVSCNNKIAVRTAVSSTYTQGAISCKIVGRNMKGTMDPEAELEATYAFWTKAIANTESALSLVIGGTSGNIATITAPKVQYAGVSLGNRDGLITYPLDLYFARSSGEDEFSIALT